MGMTTSMMPTTTMKKGSTASGAKTTGPAWILFLCAMFVVTMATNSTDNNMTTSMMPTMTMKKGSTASGAKTFGPAWILFLCAMFVVTMATNSADNMATQLKRLLTL